MHVSMQARRRRPLADFALPLLVGLGAMTMGCLENEKDAADPGAIVREEIVTRVGPPSRQTTRTVRCGCDADGELHITAPEGSVVTVPDDAKHPSEAEILLPPTSGEGTPLRRTKSLGFVGDGKLSELPTYGGPWNVPDALLPQHRHTEQRYPSSGYGYRPYSPVPYAYPYGGSSSWSQSQSQSQSQSSQSSQSQSQSFGASSPSQGSASSPPPATGPGWR